jgi:hypothetical protein
VNITVSYVPSCLVFFTPPLELHDVGHGRSASFAPHSIQLKTGTNIHSLPLTGKTFCAELLPNSPLSGRLRGSPVAHISHLLAARIDREVEKWKKRNFAEV